MKRWIAIACVVVVTSVVSSFSACEQITLNAETAKTAEKKSQDFSACSASSALKRRFSHSLFSGTVTVAQTPRAEMTRVPQFDNDRAVSWKSIIPPHTESTLHRHDRFRTIIGIVGGDLATVDAKGRKTVTHYETGKSYWQQPMPAGEMHKDVNDTNKAIELIVVENK
jgi:hypothetical protein